MAFFGGQPKTTPVMESQTDNERKESADIPELPEPRSSTVIAKDLIVTGKLSGEGVVQIEGVVEGEVNLKGYVIVTATGKVKGPVEADVIRIAGQAPGGQRGRGRLTAPLPRSFGRKGRGEPRSEEGFA